MPDIDKFIGESGLCTACKEWTNVLEPCCNAPVFYEGSYIDLDDFDPEELEEYENRKYNK